MCIDFGSSNGNIVINNIDDNGMVVYGFLIP